MFCKDDKIVYGSTGVCLIDDICEKEIVRNKKQQYYILKPIFQPNNTIYAPVNGGKVAMRPLISAKEADALIAEIPKIIDDIGERSLSNEDYRATFSTQNCADLVVLSSIIYQKRKNAAENKKKLGFVDEKYMRLAEDLLFGELSVALDIPFENVKDYIKSKINKG